VLAPTALTGQSAGVFNRAQSRRLSARRCSWLAAPTAALFALAPATSGCSGGDCKAYAAAALIVRVVDEVGTPVCDAVVAAKEQGFSEVLRSIGSSDEGQPCQYIGVYERTGTYTIEAARGGSSAEAANVRVGADDCHVHPETVDLTLSR
jgi:hypothetical protein